MTTSDRSEYMARLALRSAAVRRQWRAERLRKEVEALVKELQRVCPHTWGDDLGCLDCGLPYSEFMDSLDHSGGVP
jgi:hypothetical protein